MCLGTTQRVVLITLQYNDLDWPAACFARRRTLQPGRIDMGRLRLGLAVALGGNDAGGPPPGGFPRPQRIFVVQDSTYKPLLAARDSFWARVGSDRQIRLFYQGNTPTDTGPEFLRFEVANDALLRRPDGSAFGHND